MLSENLKNHRNRLGLTQDLLAEMSGVSTRTIQRIENGETTPRGDTLLRIARTLDLEPSDLLQDQKKEDSAFLTGLCASAFSFLIFPVLAILLPFILWITKRDEIKKVQETGKDLINMQITWNIILFIAITGYYIWFQFSFSSVTEITVTVAKSYWGIFYSLLGSLYLYNFSVLLINIYSIRNDKTTWFMPRINFIRS